MNSSTSWIRCLQQSPFYEVNVCCPSMQGCIAIIAWRRAKTLHGDHFDVVCHHDNTLSCSSKRAIARVASTLTQSWNDALRTLLFPPPWSIHSPFAHSEFPDDSEAGLGWMLTKASDSVFDNIALMREFRNNFCPRARPFCDLKSVIPYVCVHEFLFYKAGFVQAGYRMLL